MGNAIIKNTRTERIVWLVVVFILVMFLIIQFVNDRKTLSITHQKEKALVLQIEILQDSLMQTRLLTENQPGIKAYEINDLREMGLENPVEDIKNALLKHRELIPFKAVLGGTMSYVNDAIYVLNTEWVHADFDDGHIGGSMILRYRISTDGKISWKVVDSVLY